MYKITYKKRNGIIFQRIRNTLPIQTIGQETSMGWIILDIKKNFNGKYYSFAEYKQVSRKKYKLNHINTIIKIFFKRYSTTITLIILLPLYILK